MGTLTRSMCEGPSEEVTGDNTAGQRDKSKYKGPEKGLV